MGGCYKYIEFTPAKRDTGLGLNIAMFAASASTVSLLSLHQQPSAPPLFRSLSFVRFILINYPYQVEGGLLARIQRLLNPVPCFCSSEHAAAKRVPIPHTLLF